MMPSRSIKESLASPPAIKCEGTHKPAAFLCRKHKVRLCEYSLLHHGMITTLGRYLTECMEITPSEEALKFSVDEYNVRFALKGGCRVGDLDRNVTCIGDPFSQNWYPRNSTELLSYRVERRRNTRF